MTMSDLGNLLNIRLLKTNSLAIKLRMNRMVRFTFRAQDENLQVIRTHIQPEDRPLQLGS